MQSEFFAGKIIYSGPEGENGREWFESVPHAGGRTLRAFCEMDNAGLTRDTSYSLGPDGSPTDGFVRVIKNGKVAGTTLFLIEDRQVVCEGVIAEMGRLSQCYPTADRTTYLGLHPLVGDALAAVRRGTEHPGEFITVHGVANSRAANGDEGLYAMSTAIDTAYIGEEEVTVAAGTFAARRYALRWHPQWEPADLWVSGPEGLFLLMEWKQIGARYELTELRTTR